MSLFKHFEVDKSNSERFSLSFSLFLFIRCFLHFKINHRRATGSNANIAVHLDVFDEQRECDDAQSLQGPSGINLNSHLDVFYTILGQVI